MKLTFICNEYPPGKHGGIGSMVQTLGRGLAIAGHDVRVVGIYSDVRTTTWETDEGVRVCRLARPAGRLQGLRARHRLFHQIREWVRERDVDLIEVPDYQGWAALWPPLRVPVVTRLHGSATYFAREMGRRTAWAIEQFESSSVKRSDFWCSVSAYTAAKTKALFNLAHGPHAILPNAVPVGTPAHWAARNPDMVVYTGTLTAKKGVVSLIDAWRDIARRFPAASLHLAGKDGEAPEGGGLMTAYLQARLPREIASTVHFHGHVTRERVQRLLNEARVAVFPSFAEAFAVAPLEAMASGCPTIASALGSGPELIEDGVDGLTVDPSKPAEIEEAIGRLLGNEPFAREIGDNGRRKVSSRFSLRHSVDANVHFYQQCVAAHDRRH